MFLFLTLRGPFASRDANLRIRIAAESHDTMPLGAQADCRGFFVVFSWLFRGPLLSRKTVFGPFSLLFRGFSRGFFVAPVLGKFYAYSPWNSLLNLACRKRELARVCLRLSAGPEQAHQHAFGT